MWLAGAMKPLTISDAESIVVGLQQEIQRSEESRYDHRLHGVLLVAQGLTCPEVGHLLGDAPRTVDFSGALVLDESFDFKRHRLAGARLFDTDQVRDPARPDATVCGSEQFGPLFTVGKEDIEILSRKMLAAYPEFELVLQSLERDIQEIGVAG